LLQNIHIAAYEENLFDIACENIFQQHTNLLPDLSSITVFLPNQLSQKLFHKTLMQHAAKHACHAVLLPQLTTLRAWALSQHIENKPLLSQYARELILVDAIKKQPSIFFQANPWIIANELLSFFDAMQLNNVSFDRLKNESNAYLDQGISSALSQEAKLVITLWHAWQEQVNGEHFTDPVQAYSNILSNLTISKNNIYYVIGIEELRACEAALFNKMQHECYLYALFHASGLELCTKPDTAIRKITNEDTNTNFTGENSTSLYSKFLDSVFLTDKLSIKERATAFSQACPSSPLKGRIKLFKAHTFEQHVAAIDIKIRCYLLSDRKNIAVITSDRKLARRLRAVLEHANVQTNDLGGWALATTSTIVIIENWLQLIEDGCAATTLLALLKSPFFPIKIEAALHKQALNFLEKDVILSSKLHRGIHTFRNKLEQKQSSDNETDIELYTYLYELLDQLEASIQALAKLQKSNKISLQQFFITLINSLKISGIYSTLKNDIAGKQLLNLFETQISQLKHIENNLNWLECRRFLARILDQQNFKPTLNDANVTFCSLEQSKLLKFDAIIIASASKDYLPGNASNYIFFNESIRKELNLTTWRDENSILLHQFRCLLDATKDLLITTETERNGEQIKPSPWLEAIETYHKLAYEDDLLDEELIQLVNNESTRIKSLYDVVLPELSEQPSPLLHDANKPETISISQYQQLVACPYQFFAKTCLKLSKTDELQEDLEKSDFGSLIHDCIRAFFTSRPNLPGPFKQIVTINNYKDAEHLLAEISDVIFKQHTQVNFNNILWLQRWKNLIPSFINWEIKRQSEFSPNSHEYNSQLKISDKLSLKGQIDRIDSSNKTLAIIDYKTGVTPKRMDVISGEKVQLPSYALLSTNCSRVEYVNIGADNTVSPKAIIKDEELLNLTQQHLVRLKVFAKKLETDMELPALSDDENCDWCDVKGICRKDYWKT